MVFFYLTITCAVLPLEDDARDEQVEHKDDRVDRVHVFLLTTRMCTLPLYKNAGTFFPQGNSAMSRFHLRLLKVHVGFRERLVNVRGNDRDKPKMEEWTETIQLTIPKEVEGEGAVPRRGRE